MLTIITFFQLKKYSTTTTQPHSPAMDSTISKRQQQAFIGDNRPKESISAKNNFPSSLVGEPWKVQTRDGALLCVLSTDHSRRVRFSADFLFSNEIDLINHNWPQAKWQVVTAHRGRAAAVSGFPQVVCGFFYLGIIYFYHFRCLLINLDSGGHCWCFEKIFIETKVIR